MTWEELKKQKIDYVNIKKDSDEYRCIFKAAVNGDKDAQYIMGLWNEFVSYNIEQALAWYKNAMKNGQADAEMSFKKASEKKSNSNQDNLTLNKVDLTGAKIAGIEYGNVSNASTIYGEDKFVTPRGHGFAAERANHLYDKFSNADFFGQEKVQLVGEELDPSTGHIIKNGADRIVNGTHIQTKYCSSGSKCVSECFENGKFRYVNADGSPMQIEVPSDKFDAAVKAMEERIKKGEVPGVTDPAEAKNIIRKGHFTYLQAKNIAKAGTVESLIYDSANGIIIAKNSFGISATLSFATSIWNGEPFDVAMKTATYTGLKVGGTTFVTAVLAGQFTKAGLNSALLGSSEAIIKVLGPKGSAMLVNAFRSGKNIYGAAAMKSAAKMLRTNVITNVASVVVMSSADVANIFRSRISGKQLFKNLAETTVSVAGGTAGWAGGATAGAAIGSFVPVIGTAIGATVGGLVGAFAGGSLSGKAANKVLGAFIEDDADEMVRIIEGQFKVLAVDYLLTQDEVEDVVDGLKEVLTGKTLKDMFASSNRKTFANNLLIPSIEKVTKKRKVIKLPSDMELQNCLKDVLEEIADMQNEQSLEINETKKNEMDAEKEHKQKQIIAAIEKVILKSGYGKVSEQLSTSQKEKVISQMTLQHLKENPENIVGIFDPGILNIFLEDFDGILFMKDRMYIKIYSTDTPNLVHYHKIKAVNESGWSTVTIDTGENKKITISGVSYSTHIPRLIDEIISIMNGKKKEIATFDNIEI